MVGAAGSNQTPNVTTSKFSFNASTGELIVVGNITANSTSQVRSNVSISAGVLTINIASASVFSVNLTSNITTLTLTNVESVNYTSSFVLVLTADGNARSITWPNTFRFPANVAPTITVTNNKIDVVTAFTYDAGSNWLAFTTGQNL
jgi:hypothetical protein